MRLREAEEEQAGEEDYRAASLASSNALRSLSSMRRAVLSNKSGQLKTVLANA